ncbi:hypothetical protein Ddc_14818 [Ditylenchus destructor]|nr:hypothetical protein Ddc_14818 [Ditylenchus destructor]
MPVLSRDEFRDVFTFFSRRQLCRIRQVNQLFNKIILREFATAPLHDLDSLTYTNNFWRSFFDDDGILDFGVVSKSLRDVLIASKYLRFYHTNISFDHELKLKDLQDMSHLWVNRELTIDWSVTRFDLTEELIQLVSQSKSVNIYGNNAFASLPYLLKGNCEKIRIKDNRPVNGKLPLAEMAEFLYKPCAGPKAKRELGLVICCNRNSYHEDWKEFINTVEQKFAQASSPVHFYFGYKNVCDDQAEYRDSLQHNDQAKSKMRLQGVRGKFYFNAEPSNMPPQDSFFSGESLEIGKRGFARNRYRSFGFFRSLFSTIEKSQVQKISPVDALNRRKRNQFSTRRMANMNETGNAIANANLEHAENRIDEALPDDLLKKSAYVCYLLYAPIKVSTELQSLMGISYKIGLCLPVILAYPIYRVIPRAIEDRWRGWAELTQWNGLKYELTVFAVYAAFSLSKFLHLPLAILAALLFLKYVPENVNAESKKDRSDQDLPDNRLGLCMGAFYIVYPGIIDTAELQSMIGISYDIGLCVALVLAYPFFRMFNRGRHPWRGWLIELTHWNGLEHELFVLRVFAACSLTMFHRIPLVTLVLSLVFAFVPLRYRIASVVLVASFSYFWRTGVLTSRPLLELIWTLFSIGLCSLGLRLLD